jgi:sugar lactone lactonase YvrE
LPTSHATRSHRRGIVATFALAVLALSIAAGLGLRPSSARGDETEGPAESLVPTAAQTKNFLDSGKAGSLTEEPETDLHAAETMPHRDLERGEALELAEAVFEPEIEAAGGIYDEIEPERFLSDYAAVVPISSLPEGSDRSGESLPEEHPNMPVLLESMLPLRIEDSSGEEKAVDLGLERAEGELQPQNPLAEVGIPEQLGEGISLSGPGVEMTIAGAPENRSATDAGGEFAFYPEVAEDTDLIVAPTPRGLETMTDIRSAEAPTQTTYDLALPSGAELRGTGEGGAEIVEGDRPTLFIPPPTAIDAAGDPVQTELTVSGQSITVSTTPNDLTSFPILVDPTLIQEGWRWTLNHDTLAAWRGSTSNATVMQPLPYEIWASEYPGLDISSGLGGYTSNGAEANWKYWIPRYSEDLADFGTAPKTWVYQMFNEGVLFLPYGSTANYPALILGLVDPSIGWQDAEVHYGYQGEMNNWANWFLLTNENPANHEHDTYDKGADVELFTPEAEYPAKRRDIYAADAYISIVDEEPPTIPFLNPPEEWMNTVSKPIAFDFEDKGMGVAAASMSYGGTALPGAGLNLGCNGTTAYPCPRIARSSKGSPGETQASLTYNPVALPTGKDPVTVTDSDAIALWGAAGHTASGTVVLKVDHTGPEVSLSGPLTEQASLGTRRPTYALRIKAKDGVIGAPQSGVKKVEVKVDGAPVPMSEPAEWEPNCQTENCSVSDEWTLNSSGYAAGPHEVQVVATDAVGNVTTKTLQIELRHPAPSLEAWGSLVEGGARELPSYKLRVEASSLTESPPAAGLPTYSSSFGTSGTGNGQFAHPGDIALGREGEILVVDTNNNRIEKFSGPGGYLGQFGTKGSGNGQLNRPTAIAVAANGNLWVTDSGNKRVEEFTPSGACVAQFGEPGTGPGQFAGSGPEGIAIDYHGNVWVSDTYGGRLEKFSEEGKFIRSVGTKGTGYEQLGEPTAVDIAPGGQVYVTDWEDDKVAEYGEGGAFIRQFGSQGNEPGQLQQPTGIAIDSRGDIWVGDQNNGRVEEFNQAGEYLGRFGTAGSGQGQFSLQYPIGIMTDGAGDIWVTDPLDNRVEKWVSAGYLYPAGFTWVRTVGSTGSGNGQYNVPTDVTVDPKGNIWVTDYNNNRIEKLSESGGYLGQFGSAGTGNGQFNYPVATAIDPAGHLWVLDRSNNRVEEFSEAGVWMRTIGGTAAGTGNGQFNFPSGIAVDSKNHVWVADTNNNRLEEFNGESGAFIRTVGKEGSVLGRFLGPNGVTTTPEGNVWVSDTGNNRLQEFSETGAFLKSIGSSGTGPGRLGGPTDVMRDPAGHLWVAEEGNHRVQELTEQGEFLGEFGSAGTYPNQFQTAYALAFAHNGNLLVADYASNRVSEWKRPALHSQISTEITVDGRRVDAGEAGCSAETCTLTREWTLQTSQFTPGTHVVAVRATDGLGNTTTETFGKVKIGDTTKPALEVGGELVSAPAGWIEQEEGNYGLHATATDGGYGVTSLVFKIDGKSVVSKEQACPVGRCSANISTAVNAHTLAAGAHEGEVVATDGAGNIATKKWMVNVDPEGSITTDEAEATVEALETTSPVNLIGESKEEAIEGTEPGLGLEVTNGELEAAGGNMPVTISTETGGEMELEVAGKDTFWQICDESDGAESEEAPSRGEESSESGEGVEATGCVPRAVAELRAAEEEEEVARGEKTVGREPITITPIGAGSEAEDVSIVEGVAAVSPNTSEAVDTVTRPLSDGGLDFEDIRSSSAPEHYAFEIESYSSELELRQVSPQAVTAFYTEGGYAAFTLEAEPAHDAVGHAVPTHLTLNGPRLVTLTVEHRGLAAETGQPFVYPVVGGTGWQGGWFYGTVERYVPEEEAAGGEEGEEEEGGEEGGISESRGSIAIVAFGPPAVATASSVGWNSEPRDIAPHTRRFKFTYCWPKSLPGVPGPPGSFAPAGWGVSEDEEAHITPQASECHNEEFHGIHWATSVHGHFEYKTNHWVRVMPNSLRCNEWGEEAPQQEHCKVESEGQVPGPAYVVADYRFHGGKGDWAWLVKPTCFVTGGKIYPRESEGTGVPYERPMLWEAQALTYAEEQCDWQDLEKNAKE